MRIIGQGEGGFLCIMTTHEICKLAGFDSIYSAGWKEHLKEQGFSMDRWDHVDLVGGKLDIDERWERFNAIESKEKEIAAMAARMRLFADVLDKVLEKPILTLPEPVF